MLTTLKIHDIVQTIKEKEVIKMNENKTVVEEYSLAPYEYEYLLSLKKTIYITDLVKVKDIKRDYQLSSLVSNKIKLLKKDNQTYLKITGKLTAEERRQFDTLNMYLDKYTEDKEQIPLFLNILLTTLKIYGIIQTIKERGDFENGYV